jgi:dolichyl-phosphate-mannose--protein O-mannosyl transferase
MSHFYARAFSLIIVPIFVYLFWFYVHFAILNESGPGDSFMSTRFQDTLKFSPLKMAALGKYIKSRYIRALYKLTRTYEQKSIMETKLL